MVAKTMKYLKWYPGQGYITVQMGSGISDIFSAIFRGGTQVLSKVPPDIMNASKDAATNIATSGVKTLGNKAGKKLADKIIGDTQSSVSTQDIREKVLRELNVLPDKLEQKKKIGFDSKLYKELYGSGLKYI